MTLRFPFLAGALLWTLVPASSGTTNLSIVTTILPLYCFTVGVAGDRATVENLIPENASGHDYQLTPGDARKLDSARLIVTTGLGLEAAMLGRDRGGQIVKAATGIRPIRGQIHEDHRHGTDINPHFWLDPVLAAHAVTNIAEALKQTDPANAAVYARNATAYVDRLHKLDQEISAALGPYRGRAIVTYHDAFAYFARRYELRVAGVVQETADVDPTARHLTQLRKVVSDSKVRVLFVEPGRIPKQARQLASDLRVALQELDPLEAGRTSPTAYEEGMRRNLAALKKAFDAPVP